MSECGKILRLLGPYIDGKLNAVDADRVSAHLSECSECTKKLETLENLPGLLDSIPPQQLPSSLAFEISGKIRQTKQPVIVDPEHMPPLPWYRRPLFAIPGALATTFIAFVVIIAVFRPDAMAEAAHQFSTIMRPKMDPEPPPPIPIPVAKNNLAVPKPYKDLPAPEVALTDNTYTGLELERAGVRSSVVGFMQAYRIMEVAQHKQAAADRIIAEAGKKGLSEVSFQKCLDASLAANGNPAVPSYAEQAIVNNQPALVIVLNWDTGKPTKLLSRTAIYAMDPEKGSIIQSWPPKQYARGTGNPHKSLACIDCHPNWDLGKDGKKWILEDWKRSAELACIDCKRHKPQYDVYKDGIHGKLALARRMGWDGEKQIEPPTCADCHSGHSTLAFGQTPRSIDSMRAEAFQVCGVCHMTYWNSYSDYYHGDGYKANSPDAPTCWDCHGAHEMVPSSNPKSRVNQKNLLKTCRNDNCHPHADRNFIKYGKLIHGKRDVQSDNPLIEAIQRAFGKLGEVSGRDKK